MVALAKRAGVGDQERHTARPLAPMSSISATILQFGLPGWTKSCRVRRLTVLSTSSRIMTTSFLFCTQHRHRHNHVPTARTRLRQDRTLVHSGIPAIRARRAARSDSLDGARRQMAAQEVRSTTTHRPPRPHTGSSRAHVRVQIFINGRRVRRRRSLRFQARAR